MASRLVTYAEWLEHGHYPDGSNPGAKFNPDDKNLRSYYDNYVSTWNGAAEALRIAINVQHGLGSFNSGGGDGGDGGGGGDPAPPTGPVFTPLDLSAPSQNDYWDYYPQSYMPVDPAYPTMGLLSQPYGNNVDTYQPWSQQYGDALVADNLWNYNPPSLPGPGVSYFNAKPFTMGGSESGGTSPGTPPSDPNKDPGWNEGGGGADDPMAEERDMVDVNGVAVPRGFTTYNGEIMTFADAERARQAGLIQPGDKTGDMAGWGGGDSSQGSGGSSGVGPGGVNGGVGKGY